MAYAARLADAPWGVDRFVPQTMEETMASIYEMWNILDAIMRVHSNVLWQTGYVREHQVRRMVELVRSQPPSRIDYCEVGMNGGHSTVAMLLASPNVSAHVFDILAYRYSAPVATLLRTRFGARFELHPGNSHDTLGAWATSGHGCDISLVDGDHSLMGSRRDLIDLWPAARPSSSLIVDDVVPKCPYLVGGLWNRSVEESHCRALAADGADFRNRVNAGPGMALRDLIRNGVVAVHELIGPARMGTPINPCLRGPHGPLCRHEWDWGYAVLSYQPMPQEQRQRAVKAAERAKSVEKRKRRRAKKGGWDPTCSSSSCLRIVEDMRTRAGPWV